MDRPLDNPPDRNAAWRSWLAFAAVLLALWAVVSWVQQPPEPLGLDAVLTEVANRPEGEGEEKLSSDFGESATAALDRLF